MNSGLLTITPRKNKASAKNNLEKWIPAIETAKWARNWQGSSVPVRSKTQSPLSSFLHGFFLS